jgi:hypothetical protein
LGMRSKDHDFVAVEGLSLDIMVSIS